MNRKISVESPPFLLKSVFVLQHSRGVNTAHPSLEDQHRSAGPLFPFVLLNLQGVWQPFPTHCLGLRCFDSISACEARPGTVFRHGTIFRVARAGFRFAGIYFKAPLGNPPHAKRHPTRAHNKDVAKVIQSTPMSCHSTRPQAHPSRTMASSSLPSFYR